MKTAIQRGGNYSTVAACYGVAQAVVRACVKNGEVRAHKIGGKTCILFSDWEDYVRRQPAPIAWRKRNKPETFPCPATL
jgi:hypothetical protein